MPTAGGEVKLIVVDNDSIYTTTFAICRGGPRRAAYDWLAEFIGKESLKERYRDPSGEPNATFFSEPGILTFSFWFRDGVVDKRTPYVAGIIAHEALHATVHVMRAIGIEITEASEEALTYYHSYVVREIHKHLWPERKRRDSSSREDVPS
jgi:hypothetical protein